LLSKDFRFAESAEYTFQCLHWVESISVSDGITFALKKSRQDDVSVLALQNPENLQKMFKDDELFASFKRIRGTPQYWKEMQQDMLAKIRYYGPYTFFISCSAADFHWPELIHIVAKQYGEHYDLQYIEEEMDKKTKRTWLARNPVTVARHIDFIFRKLWGNVILSGLHPVGQILNYDIRKEMQSRGTAHFHSAVHVKDAPIVDKNPDDDVISLIDKHISSVVPQVEEDDSLRSLVLSRQVHHHTRTCKKKKGLECRFHFPKPPSTSTLVSRVPCEENSKQTIQLARGVILQVMNTLQEIGIDHTLSEILTQSNVTEQEYNDALKVSMKKTNIILKREPSDTCVNPYNPVILKCIRANMDIQYITDVWACVAYITSYMCKPEKSMSDLMRNACKEAATVKEKLKSIGNVFLKSREVSQHEAIARLVQMPLKESNVPVMFVPTGFKHQRTRLLKPRNVLEKMEDDDTDVFLPNIIDKYCARPSKLENMCLAEFASSYSRTYSHDTDQHDDEDSEGESVTKIGREKITLKDNLGTLVKRKTPLVLRDYFVSKDRDAEKYFHRLLFLYLPWREEDELENCGSYEDKFKSVKDKVSDTVQKYEPYLDEVVQANEMFENIEDNNEEIWDTLAPQAEQNRDIEDDIGETNRMLDIDNLTEDQLEFDQQDQQEQVPHTTRHSLTSNISIESESRYSVMVRSLNPRQKIIHDHILSWCRQMNLATSVSEEPPPFHIFLSGGAGVGKSHTVHTIYQSAFRILKQPGKPIDLPTVILTAPTGKAAVNIGGTTLHNAFRLPVKKRGCFETKHHSNNSLNSMRSMYTQMKILVIDEISMVGATTLSNLNVTMQEIFENERPLGGIAVLGVGDLLQLNPVGEKPVYKECKSGYGALATSVWDLFKLYELTDIVRQKDDPAFAELLSRVRVGQHKKDDVNKLKELEKNCNVPNDALSVFLTNQLKDVYNKTQLGHLTSETYTITAKDSKRDLNTKRVVVNVTSSNMHETAGLAGEIQFAENAKYMQTKNVDIQDGLVNGATGTIMKLDISADKPLNGTIYVRFDDPKIGKQAKSKSRYKNLVPIKAITAGFSITDKSSSVQVERTQFPGTLAWGITVHKSQGSTFEQMIGDMTTPTGNTNTMPGQIYTMLSRSKSMKGLKLCAFDSKKIKVNETALQEMERLKKNNLLQPITLHSALQPPESSFCVLYLNIRSLKEHFEDISQYIDPEYCGILCFSETKVYNYSKYKLHNMECIANKRGTDKHGNVIYSTLSGSEEILFQADIMEIVAVKTRNLLVVSVYTPPGQCFQRLLKEIENLI